VRRIPDTYAERNKAAGQGTLFDVWRSHAFFTSTDPDRLDTVAADKIHRHHAIIEQVHADLKGSALAHLPSGKFTANAAGSSWRSSRSTSPAPPPPSPRATPPSPTPAHAWPKQPPRPSVAS